MGAEMVIGQVGGGVNKNLVNGVGVDIVRGDELQIGLVDLGGDLQIPGHAGRCNNEFDLQTGVFFQSLGICRSPGKVESSVLAPQCLLLPDRSLQSLGVGLVHPLHHLEQPGPSGDLVPFERGGDRQTDGLFSAGGVRHHQMGGQRVQPPVHALHRGIKALEVYGKIGALRFQGTGPPFCCVYIRQMRGKSEITTFYLIIQPAAGLCKEKAAF